MTDEIPSTGPCIVCKEEPSDENLCYGCKALVCDDCYLSDIFRFTHRPEEHIALTARN
jgi:hypothetical protein